MRFSNFSDVEYFIEANSYICDKNIKRIECYMNDAILEYKIDTIESDGYFIESSSESVAEKIKKGINALIKTVTDFIKKCAEQVKTFFESKKTKEEMNKLEDAASDPELKNAKVEVPDVKAIEKAHDTVIDKLKKKLRQIKSKGSASKSDMDEIKQISEDGKKKINIAAGVVITMSLAATVGLIHHLVTKGSNPTESIKAVEENLKACENVVETPKPIPEVKLPESPKKSSTEKPIEKVSDDNADVTVNQASIEVAKEIATITKSKDAIRIGELRQAILTGRKIIEETKLNDPDTKKIFDRAKNIDAEFSKYELPDNYPKRLNPEYKKWTKEEYIMDGMVNTMRKASSSTFKKNDNKINPDVHEYINKKWDHTYNARTAHIGKRPPKYIPNDKK